MARSTFGGTTADYLFSVTSGAVRTRAATLTFWTAETGGAQITDLLLGGEAVTSIRTGSYGFIPAFSGPDETTEIWGQVDEGRRLLFSAAGRPGPTGPGADVTGAEIEAARDAAEAWAVQAEAAAEGVEPIAQAAGRGAAIEALADDPTVAAEAAALAQSDAGLVRKTDAGIPTVGPSVRVAAQPLDEVVALPDDTFLEGRRGATKVLPALEVLNGGTTRHRTYTDSAKATVMGPGAYNGDEVYAEDRLDAQGRIPLRTIQRWLTRAGFGTPTATKWTGRSVLVLGTSITAFAGGYADQLADRLGCTVINNAVGSSGVVFDTAIEGRYRSLSATVAELAAASGGSTWADQSYEQRVIPYLNGTTANVDHVHIDHAYNDRGYTLGTIDSTSKATFYGAMNFLLGEILTAKPKVTISLQTPPCLATPFVSGTPTANAGTAEKRLAVIALGLKWGIPVFDLTSQSLLSVKQAPQWIADGVHPDADWHTRIGGPRLAAWLTANPPAVA